MIPNAPRPFDFALGEGADMIRESARDFAEKEIAPRAAEIDRDNLSPATFGPRWGRSACMESPRRRNTGA